MSHSPENSKNKMISEIIRSFPLDTGCKLKSDIRSSEDVQDVFRKFYIRSIYVVHPVGFHGLLAKSFLKKTLLTDGIQVNSEAVAQSRFKNILGYWMKFPSLILYPFPILFLLHTEFWRLKRANYVDSSEF